MKFNAALTQVHNRGAASLKFLTELVEWAKSAPDELFSANNHPDIYDRVLVELGPYTNLLYRKAVLLEVLRVLGLFESGCDWNEGEDTTRRTTSTNENKEAGPWQQSYNCRNLNSDIPTILENAGIDNGIKFQEAMKKNHTLSMTVTTLVLRSNMRDFHKIANGPLRKGKEREWTWPDRQALWSEKESIYPYLKRAAVGEFIDALK